MPEDASHESEAGLQKSVVARMFGLCRSRGFPGKESWASAGRLQKLKVEVRACKTCVTEQLLEAAVALQLNMLVSGSFL